MPPEAHRQPPAPEGKPHLSLEALAALAVLVLLGVMAVAALLASLPAEQTPQNSTSTVQSKR